jgi:Uma2 family endonuclease
MFTIYNEEEDQYISVEEPDPSLTYTYADYLQWKFEERVELIRGKIFKMSPAPNLKHQQVSGRMFNTIYNYLNGKTCQVFVAPFDVRLPIRNKKKPEEISTVVQPNICVVCDESKLDERGVCGAPDLIIEILSPGNSKKEVRIKHELYEEAGVKEYWVVYPAEESIAVFHLNYNGRYNGASIYAAGDIITSVAVAGFAMAVNDVFSTT